LHNCFSGSSFLVRANGDLFCIGENSDPNATVDTSLSNRFYAAALTARASGTTVDIRSSRVVNGCNGNFPQVVDLRVN